MAGERQHYIPRFLLKGFSSRTSAQKTFVWYFRKGIDSKEVSIRDIALEKNFYGDPGEGNLDCTIAEKESNFARVIDIARKDIRIADKDVGIVVDFVNSIVIQNMHTRRCFTDGFSKLLQFTSTKLSSPLIANQSLMQYLEKDKENVRNVLRSGVQKQLGFSNPIIEDLVIRLVEENLGDVASMLGPIFAQALEKFSTQIQEEAKTAHNKSLKHLYQDSEPSLRLEEYKRLKWGIRKFEPGTFILGDVGILQMNIQSYEFYPAIATSAIEDSVLLLPISHDILLIGSSRQDITLPTPNDINANMAEVSLEFFVASMNREQERSLSEKLGNRSKLIDDKSIEELEKKYFQ